MKMMNWKRMTRKIYYGCVSASFFLVLKKKDKKQTNGQTKGQINKDRPKHRHNFTMNDIFSIALCIQIDGLLRHKKCI